MPKKLKKHKACEPYHGWHKHHCLRSRFGVGKSHRHEIRIVLLTQMGGVPVGAVVSGASAAEITSAQKLDMSNVQLLVMDRGYKKYGF